MRERQVGDIRTFENHQGNWEVRDIHKDKHLVLTLQLKKTKCPKCQHEFGESRNYTFDYIEKLLCGPNIKYLGVSTCGRYILLDDYLDMKVVEEKIKEVCHRN